jgi:hypothetical protein
VRAKSKLGLSLASICDYQLRAGQASE